MLKDCNRSMKLERILHKEIAIIIQKYLKDPRLNSLITISEVKLSSDFNYAKVFMMFLNTQNDEYIQKILNVLRHAAGYIRFLINQRIYLRVIPKLYFVHDLSFMNGIFISKLIDDHTSSIQIKNI